MLKREQHYCEESNGICYEDDKQVSFIPEPETPQSGSCQTRSKTSDVCTVRGNLIHLSKSADGKLRWLPPSSTASSSITEDKQYSGGCYLELETGREASTISSSLKSISDVSVNGDKSDDLLCYEDPETYGAAGPANSTLTTSSRCCDVSESFGLIHDDSVSICPQIPTTSESSQISVSSHIKESGLNRNERVPSSVRHGLTPYLSAKLKPGRHILGVRKVQVFIRPGQLRHWAGAGNSPAIVSSNINASQTSPSTTKGKACRTLNF